MRLLLVLFLLLTLCSQAGHRLSKERVLLITDYGHIKLAFYPEVAPEHTRQILKLVSLGAYNTTHFHRVEPGFVLQLSEVENRTKPLSAEQKAALKKIPGEFSQIKHRRGLLSMARWEDPNSAESSFSIMLGPAPHLDGSYTIFGEVVAGMETVDKIVGLPRDGSAPKQRVTVREAKVL